MKKHEITFGRSDFPNADEQTKEPSNQLTQARSGTLYKLKLLTCFKMSQTSNLGQKL